MNRPDFSDFVAHFTKDSEPFVASEMKETEPAAVAFNGTAYDKIVSMLQAKTIYATPMPWTKRRAVAFTECPFWSLLDHAKRYSPYGIGFTKSHLFAAGGGPAIYMRADLFEKQKEFHHKDNNNWKGFHPHLFAFVTPFSPEYAPTTYLDTAWRGQKPVDYSHEREWRCPHDFTFELDQVRFVTVKSYEDVARFPSDLKDAIGRDRFIILDVYHQIESLWPTHNI